MSTANLDAANIAGVAYQGLINEDVMQKIWDISKIPLPLTDRIGSGSSSNPYKEWTRDSLATPSLTNAYADGAVTNTVNDTNPDESGTASGALSRVGNHHQISVKVVNVSTRAQNTDNIGRSNELAYQVMMRQQELKRDVEAIALSNQASLAATGNTAGKSGGLPGWLTTNIDTAGSGGGFGTTTADIVDARTTGTERALTEKMVRDVVEGVYNQGGDPTIFMSVPAVIRKFSEYMFTSSARVGTLISDQGKSKDKAAAIGSVNVFVTDFGTLEMVPNRIQQLYNTSTADVFVLDPKYLSFSYLHGYRTEPLAKTGLSDLRQMSVDWTLCVNTELAHGACYDIDSTLAVTAS